MARSEAAGSLPTATARAPRAAALYLGVVQFLFATTWIVYVIYLPRLLESVGVAAALVPWVLLLDQLIFMVADVVMGVAADRVERLAGRLGPVVLAGAVVSG